MAEAAEKYMVDLVIASREPQRYGEELAKWIHIGASPRATIALDAASRARAWLHGNELNGVFVLSRLANLLHELWNRERHDWFGSMGKLRPRWRWAGSPGLSGWCRPWTGSGSKGRRADGGSSTGSR